MELDEGDKMTLTEIQSRVDKIEGYRNALLSQKDSLESEIKGLKDESNLLTKVSTVLKHLLDVLVKDEISKMAGLITYGLKTIFQDQNLSFMPVIMKKNEKIHIELKTYNGEIEGEYGSFGGSVAVIESFLLRVLSVLKLKLARLMLLDETFAAVGWEYIPNTSKLISELSEKIGLDVLLVTHQKEFQQYAKNVYRIRESSKGLVMEKIK